MRDHEEEFLLSAYLDGELAGSERSRLQSHLVSCRPCRLELESLRDTKSLVASAPRRAMPPELIAGIEGRLSRRPWLERLGEWVRLPRVWIPAGAAAALLAGLWWGMAGENPEREVPLEPLLAAHSRYSAEALVPEDNLVASNYSVQLTAYYGEGQDQETE